MLPAEELLTAEEMLATDEMMLPAADEMCWRETCCRRKTCWRQYKRGTGGRTEPNRRQNRCRFCASSLDLNYALVLHSSSLLPRNHVKAPTDTSKPRASSHEDITAPRRTLASLQTQQQENQRALAAASRIVWSDVGGNGKPFGGG
ncbi:uncharacterized protein MYCGRDRAFT_97625 [Zymoseptoria tritici IPO323]|uniref:Uncharacterized protein n=1 Tax=Zymoseptoria tritici (strain CBS 115943 / IPO323) TaxID=336722 RepID=F9XR22_ZYMTI|nr:uncharacterized protein MYCGRDRAFT_97625 [Zymoseptoria tritici IPO323]EGP82364.1 hypothetical protein MYCGRDRAFT_97625 [Zymoseptoria tritici IPO323]